MVNTLYLLMVEAWFHASCPNMLQNIMQKVTLSKGQSPWKQIKQPIFTHFSLSELQNLYRIFHVS